MISTKSRQRVHRELHQSQYVSSGGFNFEIIVSNTTYVSQSTESSKHRVVTNQTRKAAVKVAGEGAAQKQSLRQFYEIGKEYQNLDKSHGSGARSLSEASRRITTRGLRGELPPGVAESCGNASRAINHLQAYFAAEHGLGDFFICERGTYTQLSEDGVKAWKLTRECLLRLGLIAETD